MLRSTRWDDDATETIRPERPGNLPRGFPKKFGVLEGLARHDDARASRRDFPPIVWICQDDIDVRSGREIDPDIFPRRLREERPVRAVNILAPEIENDE